MAGALLVDSSGALGAYRDSQHRHQDLCWALGIEPYPVVTNFAEAMVTMKNLPAAGVPSWKRPVPEPERVPEPVPEAEVDANIDDEVAAGGEEVEEHGDEIALDRGVERRAIEEDRGGDSDSGTSSTSSSSDADVVPTPKAKRVLKPAPAPVMDNDVEMSDAEVEIISVSGPKQKGKVSAARSASASVAGSLHTESDIGSSGAKRNLDDSPSMARETAKRVRRSGMSVGTRGGLDLSEYTFEEDTAVDPEVIPAVVGKVGVATCIFGVGLMSLSDVCFLRQAEGHSGRQAGARAAEGG